VVAVVGPTATGKSDLAVQLAQHLTGEVVNADASQLYRGMDIGTAKLTTQERRSIPHHLLDVLTVSQEASVAAYQRAARGAFDDIADRGSTPVLAGGSGLYVRAALDPLDFPGTEPAVRARLEAEAEEHGSARLHRRLAELDPLAAASILPANARRVVRALEVVEITGRPFSATLPSYRYVRPTIQIGLRLGREELDRRIERRVDRMLDAGLVEEVERLCARGLREGRTASRALGYAQVLRYLDGACTLNDARHDTIRATRRFARRQESWFTRDPRVHWVDADADPLGNALGVVARAAT
jgi:tRNA dimethylallyltransferase